MKDRVLLLLGVLTVMLRCWGGAVFHSSLLWGWGVLSLGEILLSSGVCRRTRGLPLLYGFTAAAFGVAGGSVKLLLGRAFGFILEPVAALPAALLLFFSLIVWEGGGYRFSPYSQGRRPVLKELMTLLGGLVSFFFLASTLFLSPEWGAGDPLMGLTLALTTLVRAVPLLVNQTSRFLLGQE